MTISVNSGTLSDGAGDHAAADPYTLLRCASRLKGETDDLGERIGRYSWLLERIEKVCRLCPKTPQEFAGKMIDYAHPLVDHDVDFYGLDLIPLQKYATIEEALVSAFTMASIAPTVIYGFSVKKVRCSDVELIAEEALRSISEQYWEVLGYGRGGEFSISKERLTILGALERAVESVINSCPPVDCILVTQITVSAETLRAFIAEFNPDLLPLPEEVEAGR